MSHVAASRRPVVGVMGAGDAPHADKTQPLGVWLAEIGVHLLTGGGGGVMAGVSQAFISVKERKGVTIGVLPGAAAGVETETYPNEAIEVPIRTHLPLLGVRGGEELSRNHINVLTSDVVIALPGWYGTASEVQLAVRYHKPVIAFVASRDDIPGLADLPDVPHATTLEEIKQFVLTSLPDLR